MTRSSTERCHFCGAHLLAWSDRSESVILESEFKCDSCRMYELSFAYGHSEERVGFVTCQWGYDENKPHAALDGAARELRGAMAHPEWPGVRRMPLVVVADWLGDHDCPLQEAALRDCLRPGAGGE